MDRNRQDETELEELEYREEIDGQIDPDQCRESFCAFLPTIGCQPCAVDLRVPAAA